MLAASTSASTQSLAGFCSSIWRCPPSAWKRPLVVLTDKTRTANDTCEWVGSISQFIVILAFASSSCGRSAHLKCLFQADDYQTAQLCKRSSPVERLKRTLQTTQPSPLHRERSCRFLLYQPSPSPQHPPPTTPPSAH